MSLRRSLSPRNRSGAMNRKGPTTSCDPGGSSPPTNLARPKSVPQALPGGLNGGMGGVVSRWPVAGGGAEWRGGGGGGEGGKGGVRRVGGWVARHASRPGRARGLGRGPEAAHVLEHIVQADTGDILHRVVADAVLLAKVEDRHDVGVVQP